MKQAKLKSCGEAGRYEATRPVPKNLPWYKKALLGVVTLLGLELVNLTLWQLGSIPSVPSIFVSEILTCVVSFFVGRIYGVFNK